MLYELEALFDYTPDAHSEQKLPFKKGDKLSILKSDDSGWLLAELGDNRGWVPSSFLEDPPKK